MIDPWTIERYKRPGERLLRLIDLEQDTQRFITLKPDQADSQDQAVMQYELDGCTLIFPARADRTPTEIRELVRLYDQLYFEQLQAAIDELKAAA